MTQPDPTPPDQPSPSDQPDPPVFEAHRSPDFSASAPQYGAPAYSGALGFPAGGQYPGQPGYPAGGQYPGQPGQPGYPGAPTYGVPQPAPAAPAPRAPRGPVPYALISAALGLLGLVLSFFPWISLRVQFGTLGSFLADDDRSLINSTLDDLYANAWDLRWATRSVLLAVLAALLVAMPVVDRRLRGPWTLAAALLASGCASALMIVQIVNRSGMYGRALNVLSDLANSDAASTDTGGVRASLALRWGAFATAAMVFAQFAVLVVLWLRSRPTDDDADAVDAPDRAAAEGATAPARPMGSG